jgi:hypothetical protein
MLSLLRDLGQVGGVVLVLLLLAGCVVVPAVHDVELPHRRERK